MKEPKVDGAPELLARDDEEGRDEAPSDEAATSSLLELLAAPLEAPARGPSPAPERIEGVIVARLVGLDGGEALVDFGGNWAGGPLAARSLVALGEGHVGRDVAL
ncbi:MAG TPA: DUF6484 domain-containing protein, partial [Minicystis sp.]|nr:DUF6484 domain-containing protein [Minicystis sp.]